MKEDPVEWLTRQCDEGVHLREEGRDIRTQDDAEAWKMRAERWAVALQDGIMIRNSRDAGRVETLDSIPLLIVPSEHPWHDSKIPLWMHMSATGRDCPGNNPLNRHAARVDRAKDILAEWRTALPKTPKPAPPTDIARHLFASWYAERADNVKPGDRSSRVEDRRAAVQHFECPIPYDWVIQERDKLPSDHPYKTKGRRPS